ncbi:serine hydrolase domain-containing protein [Amycolatopsis sp. NPDC051071]|uniref:serine hydrolase domain-containing protein n=1 Tax=Amycolatopsis sp. NPDC051071 TaxID=3154637 RepID=UPI003418FCD5
MRSNIVGRVVATTVAVTSIAVGVPAVATAGDLPGFAGRQQIERALGQLVADGSPPGGQVVVTEHGRSREVARGSGDLRTGKPFPRESRIRIGSNTKTFVAAVVLQLVAEGKVNLDAPIERYLPGVVRGEGNDGTRISVRQLLQHTSGLPDYVRVTDIYANRWKSVEAGKLIKAAMTLKPDFAPGTGWTYSNTNYILAGLLVEKVTGKPVSTEITRRIITPLRLENTYYPRPGDTGIKGPHPRGYETTETGALIDYTEQNPSWGGAAGAMISTGEDLNRFFTALLAGRVVPPAQLAEMKRTVASAEQPGGYGLGLIRNLTSCGKDLWGHGGSIPGFRTRGGVTTDGRAVNVTVNQIVPEQNGSADVLKVADVAICGTHP